MAQKRNLTQNIKVIPILTISNDDFKKRISLRIDSGEMMLNRFILSEEDIGKLKSEYRIWTDYNLELLKQVFNTPDNEYMDSYNQAGYTFLGQLGEVPNNPVLTLKNLLTYKLENLKSLLAKSDLIKSDNIISNSNIKDTNLSKTEVFIVHGHDDLAKTKAARFVEKLGLKPIILHEQTSSGKTIIEKIEEYTNVGFGIVLYTPCDVGSKKGNENKLQSRARQNVVFEHGYLIGKIGRQNVCALVKNDVEIPNDITGVVYVKMDDDDSWQLKVAKELRSSGYDIDLNKL